MRLSQLLTVLGGSRPVTYLFRDEFTVDLAAGSVNGTYSSDGKSTRTVIDTENKLSISGGNLLIIPKAAPAYGNPALWYDTAVARAAGQLAVFKFRLPATDKTCVFGFDTDKTSTPGANGAIFGTSGLISQFDNNGGGANIGAYSAGYDYLLTLALRATGCDYFVQGGPEYPNQEFLWRSSLNNTAALYAALINNSASPTIDYMRVPETKWLPTPLLSDGFSAWGTSDGLGHAEGIAGGLGSGGSGKTWTSTRGAWGVVTNKAQASALDTGLALATHDSSNPNVMLDLTLTRAGGVAGAVLRYVDADNYIYAGHDGTNAYMVKRVAGVETTVATAAVAFGAGGLRVRLSGTGARMYWNNALVQAAVTVGDAALQTSGKHGLYTTNTGNTFDNAVVFAGGN